MVSSNGLDGKVVFENACKERHVRKEMCKARYQPRFFRGLREKRMCARLVSIARRYIRKERGLEEAMITIEKDYRRRGT